MSELSPPQEGLRKPAVEMGEPSGRLRALLLAPREEGEPLVEALRAGGYEPIAEHVDSREALLHALKPDAWDVAICQDGVPGLDGPAALRLIKGACPDLPVIIVSSTFGESIAAAAMKAGADDFIARGFLARLVPAVEREVRAAKMRRGWQEAARGLADVRARSSAFMDNSPAIAWMKEESGRLVYVNRTFEETFGLSGQSVVGRRDADWLPPAAAAQSHLHDERVLAEDRPLEFEETLPTPAGPRLWLVFKFPFRDASGKRFVGAVAIDITERKRAEEALRISENLYRDLMEHAHALICIHDLEGRILTVNESAARSLGYDRQAHLGSEITTIRDIMAPEARPGFAHYLETIRTGGAVDGIMAVQTRTGERRFWEYHNTLRTEGVETPVVRGLAFDITERKRAEESLRESEQRYRSLFESMFHGYAYCEMLFENGQPCDFVYLDVNATFEELTRLKNVVGRRVTEIIPGIRESNPELFQIYGRVALTGIPERFEIYVDALGIWFSISTFSPQKGHFVALFDNITERKRAETALLQSEERYRLLFERNLAGVFRSSLDGRLLECNDAFGRIYGYASGQEVLAHSATDLYGAPEFRGQLVETIRREKALVNYEERGRRKDGSSIWVLGNYSLVPDAKGEETIIEGTVVDITERKQLEEQLRQSQKMEAIGRLAGGVAHDFNNMLTAILGYGEVILSQLPAGHPLREDAEEIRKAGERAAALTRQLLAFGRKQILAPRLLDLNRLVADLGNMLRRLIGEDIELVTRLQSELGSVRADPGQIEQIIVNLAVNARDAMPGGGTLTIETRDAELDAASVTGGFAVRSGPYVMLAVTDTGLGMDDQTRSHIFEPFFTTKEHGKGTGLGLATVYGIVKQSGGYIWVYSEPGEGSVFRIYLPREEGTADSAAGPTEGPPARQLRGNETVLLVEDEEGVRALARKVLALHGYRVMEASSPQRAIELLAQDAGKIRLLLTDVVMPGMNGRELASEVTKRRPDVRVLLMSGYTDRVEGDSSWPLLQKPFTPDVLAGKVREVLDATTPEAT